jgi:CBS domain-containing protein
LGINVRQGERTDMLKNAGEVMIPLEKYPHVCHGCTLREAIRKIEESTLDIDGRKSLPRALLVFDEDENLLGIVRRRDILRGLEPKFLKTMPMDYRKKLFDVEVDAELLDLSTGKIRSAIKKQAGNPVSEVMQPIAATARYDDHLAKVIYKMVSRDLSLLPVLKDGKVVGVVRSVDVFQQIAGLLGELEEGDGSIEER